MREASGDIGQRTSRRAMLAAGAAVAGAALAAPMFASTAAAADGGNMIIGGNNSSAGGQTRLNSTGAGLLSGQNVFTVTDNAISSSYPAAVAGYAQGERITNGFYAFADSRDDSDTRTGHGMVIAARSGARSHILMESSGGDPNSTAHSNRRGQLRYSLGDLWFCTSAGTPGTWKKLVGPQTAGSVHAVSPRRAYDSRFIDGAVVAGGSRLVSVANGIDVNTGASTGQLVPEHATAVFFNLTVVSTVGSGFLAATPGTETAFAASSINWSTSGQVVANGTMSTIDEDRQLRVFAGGGNTDFLIDITGYTL